MGKPFPAAPENVLETTLERAASHERHTGQVLRHTDVTVPGRGPKFPTRSQPGWVARLWRGVNNGLRLGVARGADAARIFEPIRGVVQ